MTEQHEWKLRFIHGKIIADTHNEDGKWLKTILAVEIESRLNEYETLKKATEALMVSIKDTHFLQGKNECLRKSVGKDCQICEVYADILEEK